MCHGLPLRPGGRGGHRSIELDETRLFGPVAVGSGDFRVGPVCTAGGKATETPDDVWIDLIRARVLPGFQEGKGKSTRGKKKEHYT